MRKILKISLPFSGRSSLQLFDELVPRGNVNRQGFLEHPEECLRDCCVLVFPLKVRDGLALMIDVTLPALNAALGFLDVSLQEGSFHRTFCRSAMESGPFPLDRRFSDRSPLRRAMHDNRNNHRAETEAGLRLINGLPAYLTREQ